MRVLLDSRLRVLSDMRYRGYEACKLTESLMLLDGGLTNKQCCRHSGMILRPIEGFSSLL